MLQRLLSNDIDAVPEHSAQYNLGCDEGAGILDDVISYRLGAARHAAVRQAMP
jgi:glycine cleavage system aminomethyltransferase T